MSMGNSAAPIDWGCANISGAGASCVVKTGCNGGFAYCWDDGSVQAYDAIDQAVSTTVGDTFTLSFSDTDDAGLQTFRTSRPMAIPPIPAATASTSWPPPRPACDRLAWHRRTRVGNRRVPGTVLGVGLLLAGSATSALAASPRTLDLTYESSMDMVRPEVHPGIVVHHNLHVVVTGEDITEDRDRSYRTRSDSDAMSQPTGGSSGTYVSWRFEGPNRLVRTERDLQSTRTMVITITSDTQCHLDVSNALMPGYSDYKFSRIGTRTGTSASYAYFSSYTVTSTSCVVR